MKVNVNVKKQNGDEGVIELNNERSEMGWVWIMIMKMIEISKVKKGD